MPFPIGQVWFLHGLFIITLASPLYFMAWTKSRRALLAVMIAIVLFSSVQLFTDIDNLFFISHNNLYQPLIHSSFFIFGMIYFTQPTMPTVAPAAFFVCLSIALQQWLGLNPDYAFHIYAPDLYYVAGSASAIFLALFLKKYFLWAVQSNRVSEVILRFLHKHTFSIFLLHSFAIYLADTVLGLVNPQEKTIAYGIIKLSVVLTITCVMSPFFTIVSRKITEYLIGKQKQNYPLIPAHPTT